MELLAGDRLGKYEILGRLAAGGMAEVYLARILGHGGFAKIVALKRMLPSLSCEAGFREMFMQEASLAARLSHPNVVQIFDFAEEQGELYLAMEYVHGVNLRKLHADSLARYRSDPRLRVTPLLAANIGRAVARALGHAWTALGEDSRPLHLIHRDVSPHNILIGYDGEAKLADFGIAKPAERNTSVGLLKGKLLYMPPEQLVGGPLDARSDVFALGIVLYETALGLEKPLFDAGREAAVRQAVRERLITPPTRVDPDFPPKIAAAIMKALERDPARRFQTSDEFADALGEALHREAESPQEYELLPLMRRLYGDPPAIRTPPPGATRPSELDRIAEDGNAATVQRSALPPAPSVPAPMVVALSPAPSESSQPASSPRAGGDPRVRTRRLMWGGAVLAAVGLCALGVAAWRQVPNPVDLDALLFFDAGVEPIPEVVVVDVEPPPAGPDAAVAPAAVAAVVPGPAVKRAEARPAPKRLGTLVVHVEPWAHVWVDAEPFTGTANQEAAPRLTRRLGAGRHVVHLRDGAGREQHVEVLLRPESSTFVEGTIESLKVR